MTNRQRLILHDCIFRIAGVVMILCGWRLLDLFAAMMHSHLSALPLDLLVGAGSILCGSSGLMLLIMGHAITQPVLISARWTTASKNVPRG